MILSIQDYPSYEVLNFDTLEKVVGVHTIDSGLMKITQYNYDTEELEERLIKVFGKDDEGRILYLAFGNLQNEPIVWTYEKK